VTEKDEEIGHIHQSEIRLRAYSIQGAVIISISRILEIFVGMEGIIGQ
jgi:hypothetical protein